MSTSPASQQVVIDPKGSYLITGGLGGLGLKTAEWLASQGAKHLVLVARRPPKDKALETVKQLMAQGIQIVIHQMDIADELAVKALIHAFGHEWPELKGIIHAAGLIEDATLLTMDWPHFERVFAPKAIGHGIFTQLPKTNR